MNTTHAFLHAHGIRVQPEILDRLVAEAVARLPRSLYREDPRAELSPSEVRALERGGFALDSEDLGAEDPLVRTAAQYAALLMTSLTTAEAAARLGVETSRIRQRLTSRPRTLYGIRLESGWRIPDFQFDANSLLPGVAEVVARLDPELHPIAIYRWFTTPSPDLPARGLSERRLSPREWLRLGFRPATVAELAGDL
ncbi:MAG: hypothetical protein GY856_23760 [bacterium]|nr:hypothetical protein [bacterium]